MQLIRFRNEYGAFNGEFSIVACPKDEIILTWKKDTLWCTLLINLQSNRTIIKYIDVNGQEVEYLV